MIKKRLPVLTDSKTLDEVIDVLNDNLDIHMQGACDKKTLLEILVRAASLNDSIDHTCKTIEDVPGANNIRYHLGVFCPSPPKSAVGSSLNELVIPSGSR